LSTYDTPIKITVLGGSAVGTPELVEALRKRASGDIPVQLVLHGRTLDKLQAVGHAAAQMAAGCDWLQVTFTTHLPEALQGAAYVVNQVRIGGLAARAFDESFPLQFGLPGDETVGPGGFANALRTVPDVLKMIPLIEQHAPDAWLISFTNPASVVQLAVARTSSLRILGLCDVPVTMTEQAAAALGVSSTDIMADYVGMHHFGFITRVTQHGQDKTTDMLAGLEHIPNLDMDADIVRSLGALPTPYFRHFIHADRLAERQRGLKQSRAAQLIALEAELVAEYATATGRPTGLAKRAAKWYDVAIGPVLVALIEERTERYIINVANSDTHTWLPPDAIIEAPCLLDNGHLRPLAVPPPSGEIRARIQLNCAYEQLLVEAILEQSEAKALRALVMNPIIANASIARAILKLIWPNALPPKGL
jgi:6-phospho-beta-glucosidase